MESDVDASRRRHASSCASRSFEALEDAFLFGVVVVADDDADDDDDCVGFFAGGGGGGGGGGDLVGASSGRGFRRGCDGGPRRSAVAGCCRCGGGGGGGVGGGGGDGASFAGGSFVVVVDADVDADADADDVDASVPSVAGCRASFAAAADASVCSAPPASFSRAATGVGGASSRVSSSRFSGPFYTSESRGGVERRQLKLKGVEDGY